MTSSSPDARRSRLDFWQACTGFLLALFICVHLLLEGTCILSPSITNGIAWFMEATYMAQLAAPIIIVLIVIHFYIAARKMPFRAGELGIFVRHSRAFKERDTWLWLVQVFTAIVILVCAFAHVWAVMTNMPIENAKSPSGLDQVGLDRHGCLFSHRRRGYSPHLVQRVGGAKICVSFTQTF